MAPLLAYYDIRGLCEPIRYLLHYKGVDFEDKRYLNADEWLAENFTLNLDFPNLPYYIDGTLRLTQSLAILRHLARKHQLAGASEDERCQLELLEQQLVDMRTSLGDAAYGPSFEENKAEFVKNARVQVQGMADYLEGKKFLVGDHVTYVDFIAYDVLDFYEYLVPTILTDQYYLNRDDRWYWKGIPNLKEYQRRFQAIPQLQTYLKSPVYKTWPIFGPMAKFGGTGEEPTKD